MGLGINLDNIEIPEDGLAHYGVKGMQWGKRRTDAQLNAARVGGKLTKTPKNTRETDADGKGSVKKSGGDKTRYKEKAKKLTAAQLDERIQRLEKEKRYKDLNARTVSKGEELAVSIVTAAGREAGTKLLANAAAYGARKSVEKKFGKTVADQLTPLKKSKG